MSQRYFQHTFENGLALVAEKMPGVQSAAMSILLPAGISNDPADALGTSGVLSDLTLRGAGNRDSRQLTDYLDSLGLQRASNSSVYHTRYSCAAVAPKVMESIPTYADIIRRPHLPESGFESARDLATQSLMGLEDDPRQKLMVNLRRIFLPSPLGRNTLGDLKHLKKLTVERCRDEWKRRFQASGAIFAIAGNIDFEAVKAAVAKYFGDMPGTGEEKLALTPTTERLHHEKQKSEQTHIGIAYPSVQETDPDYYIVRAVMEALGGGMSGRLFTEVREKRGLCYSVSAGYMSVKTVGAIFAYAGTSNERAQKTLDCMIEEIHKLPQGITQAELDRAKIGLKSATIMAGESTGSRAGAIAQDYFIRGRIRSLDEVKKAIDDLTLDRVNAYLSHHKPGPFTVVTVGPKALKV